MSAHLLLCSSLIEQKVQELVTYLSRSLPETERATLIHSYQALLRTAEGATPLKDDGVRKRAVILQVAADVKNLGDGSDRGS